MIRIVRFLNMNSFLFLFISLGLAYFSAVIAHYVRIYYFITINASSSSHWNQLKCSYTCERKNENKLKRNQILKYAIHTSTPLFLLFHSPLSCCSSMLFRKKNIFFFESDPCLLYASTVMWIFHYVCVSVLPVYLLAIFFHACIDIRGVSEMFRYLQQSTSPKMVIWILGNVSGKIFKLHCSCFLFETFYFHLTGDL